MNVKFYFDKKLLFFSLLMGIIICSVFCAPMKTVALGWKENGVASWYGGKFQGRLTANGEYFDTYKLTAAHKELPFNTVVRVKNLTNGKHVDVRINDRGPFVKNRIIDLSFEAAKQISMTKSGTAKVQIEVIKPGDNGTYHHLRRAEAAAKANANKLAQSNSESSKVTSQTQATDKKTKWIQIAAFKSKENCDNQLSNLTKKGFAPTAIEENGLYRIGIKTQNDSESILKKLKASGFSGVAMKNIPKGKVYEK